MKGDTSNRGFGTRAVHAGQEPEPTTGAVAVPIFQTSTFVQPALDEIGRYDYARSLNPTREALETQVASLEVGAGAQAFASGMAAITALMTLVRADEHAVFSRNVYGGTFRLLNQVLDRYRIESSWVDTTDLDELRGAMKDTTRLVFLESPTNPIRARDRQAQDRHVDTRLVHVSDLGRDVIERRNHGYGEVLAAMKMPGAVRQARVREITAFFQCLSDGARHEM